MADMLEINKLLEEYTDEINQAIKEAAIQLGDDAVNELKNKSPKRPKANYAKSWRTKVEQGRNFINVKIHNSKHYRLTHLLEYGHATRNGGRTKAIPHIKPVEEQVNEKFLKAVEEIIKGGGSK